MSSEVYSYLYEKALSQGALDIYCESIYMKKNRPAYKVSIICEEENIEKLASLLLKETSTFGVRYNKFNRVTLDRKFVSINTEFGDIVVKLGFLNNELIKATPEYEDCKKIAISENLSINRVYSKINTAISENFFQKY